MGVATLARAATTAAPDLVALADAALYEAKRTGRDEVVEARVAGAPTR